MGAPLSGVIVGTTPSGGAGGVVSDGGGAADAGSGDAGVFDGGFADAGDAGCGAFLGAPDAASFAEDGGGQSADSGVAMVQGSVDGVALAALDAQATVYSGRRGASYVSGLTVALTSFASACAVFRGDAQQSGATELLLRIEREGPTAQSAVAPGNFTVETTASPPAPDGAGNVTHVTATWLELDGCCASATPEDAALLNGSVSLNALDAAHATGTFNLQFGMTLVSGSFDAPLCNFPPYPTRCSR